MPTVERRFTLYPVEVRAGTTGKIGGYAAVFSRISQNLGGFVEVVEPTAFNKSRGDGWVDVCCRYNHDDFYVLGTSFARTLSLSIDDTGLLYEADPPKSRADVVELIERGDVQKSSFAFRVINPATDEEWTLTDQGFPLRKLISVQLVDVAPVNSPAYVDTTVGKRSNGKTHSFAMDVTAAYESLARRMNATLEEVRAAGEANELRKFFKTTAGGPPVPGTKPPRRTFGPQAAAAMLARREDPYIDQT
jgi:HK97 family phage prohead protease